MTQKTLGKIEKELISHMAYIGKDSNITAMSDTVGLPLGIATKMLLNGSIKTRGVVLPLDKQIYDSILWFYLGYLLTYRV